MTDSWYVQRQVLGFDTENILIRCNGWGFVDNYIVRGKNQFSLNLTSFELGWKSGGSEPVSGRDQQLVDVRDFAEVLILLYEKPEAEGRYKCSSYTIRAKDLVEKLKAMYPNYDYPKK